MTLYTTTIQAIDPNTGELKTWQGPHVPGISSGQPRNIARITD